MKLSFTKLSHFSFVNVNKLIAGIQRLDFDNSYFYTIGRYYDAIWAVSHTFFADLLGGKGRSIPIIVQ
jgi:hypothetical protein